jgi:long-chain acyl-CoA synthetase
MSGDIGVFDEAGFLTITDRKKDLIITSGGKNIAPQNIENLFKSDPLFSQFIVIGEKRNYLTALVNINLDQGKLLAAEKNISFISPLDLYDNTAFLKIVNEYLQERNSLLARYETVKKIGIIRHDFSQQTGELTATLKVKRGSVQETHKKLIDAMYSDKGEKSIFSTS